MRAFFWFFGILNLANGLWMLLVPANWYRYLPAGVPDTGPLNVHFVRDIGAAFITMGVALCVTAPDAPRRRGVILAVMLFYVLHAAVHVADIVTGHLHGEHWLVDFPGVFLPALVLLVLSLPQWWSSPAE